MPRQPASPAPTPTQRPPRPRRPRPAPAAAASGLAAAAKRPRTRKSNNEVAETSPAAPGTLAKGRLNIGVVLVLMLGLALALLLAGLGGMRYDAALRAALRPATAVDEASAVCAGLRSQNYDALAREMDPTPNGGNTEPFNRQAFIAALRTLDQREGTVRDCSLRLIGNGVDGASILFSLSVRRTHVADPLGSLVVVRPLARGGWVISRASTFYDASYDAPG